MAHASTPHPVESHSRPDVPSASGTSVASTASASSHILRFAKSERWMHWAIAVPFLVSYSTALILVLVYNPDRTRPFRDIVSNIHRISGIALITLPLLAALAVRGDLRLHLYNVRQAWTWMFEDFVWLGRIFLSNFSSKIELPEQGKFNAGEKLNFMVLLVTYPLYVLTGILIWITHINILAWLMHFFMAAMATPLILGHMYMALMSRSGKPGLQGMISGFVDRQWAKHHYRRWYREHHETSERPQLHTPAGFPAEPAYAFVRDDDAPEDDAAEDSGNRHARD